MKKTTTEYRKWKKRNDEKNQRNKLRKKRKRKKDANKTNNNIIPVQPYKIFTVPTIFSVAENPEETIKFLNSIIQTIENIRNMVKQKNCNLSKYFLKIDMKEVKKITGDALMYLMTLIKNTKGNEQIPISWIGEFPEDKEIKQFLEAAGYIDYINTQKINLIKTNEKIQIRTGKSYVYADNKDIRKEVVDFSIEKLKSTRKELLFLFNILTEIITNIEHAYNISGEWMFDPSWYIIVENYSDKIKYTFVDNGLGIPTTVKKKVYEEFKKFFNMDTEYKYIKTALDGSYKRTQTEKRERSTGLPDVYEKLKNKKICDLIIISNSAYCCEKNPRDIKENLIGTIICWEIKKEKCV